MAGGPFNASRLFVPFESSFGCVPNKSSVHNVAELLWKFDTSEEISRDRINLFHQAPVV